MPLPVLAILGAIVGVGVGAALSQDMDEKDECTVAEASKLLGLSQYTIKKKIREKKLLGRIDGKKYMVSRKSIQEYFKKYKKPGQVLGTTPENIFGIPDEIWNSPELLPASIESVKLQQTIYSLEIEKLKIEKKIAEKSDDPAAKAKVDNLSKQIIDKDIQKLNLATVISASEARILYLRDNQPLTENNAEDIKSDSAIEKEPDRKL